jgi:cytosine deaminase
MAAPPAATPADRLHACDIVIERGRIAALVPPGAAPAGLPAVALDQGLVLPRFVDLHTHLDKGHIWQRAPNPDGTFAGARSTVAGDRDANWHAEDVRRRMDFALRAAYAHGTAAIRTHIDSIGKQTAISWPVFEEVRAAWAGRIALQAVALFPTVFAVDEPEQFRSIVATVAKYGGALGGLTFMGDPPDDKLVRALDLTFAAAVAHGLDLDFHVDESDSPHARTLERIADAAKRARFSGQVTAGHCCSLALMNEADRTRVIGKCAETGMAVVSLPMCNMYLQDRSAGRTPRWRGIAPLHELAAGGVTVATASDNTRDPFYAYGDLDMLEVWREATRIGQLDHSARPWLRVLGPVPAGIMRLASVGSLAVGAPADLVLVRARTLNELIARPQSDRAVLVAGRAIDTTPPDYRDLDGM